MLHTVHFHLLLSALRSMRNDNRRISDGKPIFRFRLTGIISIKHETKETINPEVRCVVRACVQDAAERLKEKHNVLRL